MAAIFGETATYEAILKKALSMAKTPEEKEELNALMTEMKENRNLKNGEIDEAIKSSKQQLKMLYKEIVATTAYDMADANQLEKKSEFHKELNTHKEAKWTRTKIFEQLSQKDENMKLKITPEEKQAMRDLAGIVNDIENWTKKENPDSTINVEQALLNYMKENPTKARNHTEQEWIAVLKEQGLVIKDKTWIERRF